MKGITELESIPFLKQLNAIRRIAAECLSETQIMSIRRRIPKFSGKETKEEIEQKKKEQIAKNLNDMFDSLLEEHPEATIRLLDSLIVYDEGEEHLKGAKLVSRGMQELFSEEVMGFFMSLMKSAPNGQGN